MGWKVPLIILLIAIGFWFLASRILNPQLSSETPDAGDGWWGVGAPPARGSKPDTSVRKFRVNVSEDVLVDLSARLRNHRSIGTLEGSGSHYGLNADYLKEVQKYWLEKYSWRDAEKKLNQFDQFVTNIEGIDVHYVHVKPKLEPGQKAKPIILTHGWPGSFYEFYKVIPMLTDPLKHGGSADDVFEVICPSIPGAGFSEAPHRRGFATEDAARVFNKLMLRLGLNHYYAQGGDMGTSISLNMAIMFPDNVKGLHNNDVAQLSLKAILYPPFASLWPSILMPKPEEQKALLPASRAWNFIVLEMGYFYVLSTKPDSFAHALNDSPLGLAGLILEKFASWTNRELRDLPDGGLSKAFTLDELLTNVMIYWVNGNIGSFMRLPKEEFGETAKAYLNRYSSKVPFGYGCYPNEFIQLADWMLKDFHPKLVHVSYLPTGGHFPAFEVPEIFVNDIREFVAKVEAL